MPVLILAIASLVTFCAIALLLCRADSLESRERQIHPKTTWSSREEPLPLLSIPQAFDPIWAALWEDPIEALRLIQSRGDSGSSRFLLAPDCCSRRRAVPGNLRGLRFCVLGAVSRRQSTHSLDWPKRDADP